MNFRVALISEVQREKEPPTTGSDKKVLLQLQNTMCRIVPTWRRYASRQVLVLV